MDSVLLRFQDDLFKTTLRKQASNKQLLGRQAKYQCPCCEETGWNDLWGQKVVVHYAHTTTSISKTKQNKTRSMWDIIVASHTQTQHNHATFLGKWPADGKVPIAHMLTHLPAYTPWPGAMFMPESQWGKLYIWGLSSWMTGQTDRLPVDRRKLSAWQGKAHVYLGIWETARSSLCDFVASTLWSASFTSCLPFCTPKPGVVESSTNIDFLPPPPSQKM